MASDPSAEMPCSLNGLDGGAGIHSYVQGKRNALILCKHLEWLTQSPVRLPQAQHPGHVTYRAPSTNTPPPPIQPQSREIYDFQANSLVTPLPIVRTSLSQPLSIVVTTCGVFELQGSFDTKSAVKLPGSVEISTTTASQCRVSSSTSPSSQLVGPVATSKPAALSAFLLATYDMDDHTALALALSTDDNASEASKDTDSISNSFSWSYDNPRSPTFSGETPPSVGPRTPPPPEVNEVDFECALKSSVDEIKFRAVLNNARFTTGGDYDIKSLFLANELNCALSTASNDLEELVPFTSPTFSPSYSHLNAAINLQNDELRPRDAGCHINFFCVQESDFEDREEAEILIAGMQELENETVKEVGTARGPEELEEPLNIRAATMVRAPGE